MALSTVGSDGRTDSIVVSADVKEGRFAAKAGDQHAADNAITSGVYLEDTASGQPAAIQMVGECLVRFGADLTAGDAVKVGKEDGDVTVVAVARKYTTGDVAYPVARVVKTAKKGQMGAILLLHGVTKSADVG